VTNYEKRKLAKMKSDISQFHLSELKMAFGASDQASKAALRNFYRYLDPDLTEPAFRRILYALEKRQALTPIGAGIYAIHENVTLPSKKNYVPTCSQSHQMLRQTLQETFPYLETLSWETGMLSEWMTQQPANHQIILETEREACEAVFNHLRQKYPGQVFLEPDRVMMERYVLPLPESILVTRLITQSPKKKIGGLIIPRLEKILVDVFADSDKFFAFQGEELVHIFENSFAAAWTSFLITLNNFIQVFVIAKMYLLRLLAIGLVAAIPALGFYILASLAPSIFDFSTYQKIYTMPFNVMINWIIDFFLTSLTSVVLIFLYLRATKEISYPALSKQQTAA
jgi:hypothetical protein